jgi:hypothetical protein
MRKNPQILHIGFSKCASTYLRALFRGHAQVHLAFKTGFFTPFLARDMTFDDYQRFFSDDNRLVNVESDEHLMLPGVHPELGVRTTSLAGVAEVADKIKANLPDVRLIMVVRNQASLIVSRYSEYLVTGGALTFEEFADALMGGRTGTNDHYQNYYYEIAKLLEQRFPKDNVLILLQEEMRKDTAGTADRISRFVGLDEPLRLMQGMLSERRSLSLAGMRVLATINRGLVKRSSVGGAPPDVRIPLQAYLAVVRVVRALDYYLLRHISTPAPALLSRQRASAIQTEFAADNLRFQQYLDRDIADLGYLPNAGS